MNFYLSPRDYHRYHAPCDMKIVEIRYFAGELLPVHKKSLLKNRDLFIKNERVVVVAKDMFDNRIYYVAVGALNVGKMVFHKERRIETNLKGNMKQIYKYSKPIEVKKGEELGMFKVGSTVLLFAKELKLGRNSDDRMRFGEQVAKFKASK